MSSIIDTYNDTAEEYAASRAGTEDLAELQKLRSFLVPRAKVLDVGCAAGRDTRIMKDMGLDVTGSDLAEKLLAIACRENPDISFVLADMRALPFDDQTFDAVWANAVLHHVSKQEMPGVLREFWRLLKPGGTVYVRTKGGEGVLRTSEATVNGKQREFELVTTDELDAMLTDVGYAKISLEVTLSKSRPGLQWIAAFYRKPAANV